MIDQIKIVQRSTHWNKKEYHADARPFSEVFITMNGRSYYTRLFHTIDNSSHSQAAQIQAFIQRQRQTR